MYLYPFMVASWLVMFDVHIFPNVMGVIIRMGIAPISYEGPGGEE